MKYQGNKKLCFEFKPEWAIIYPCVQPVPECAQNFYCIVCEAYLSCARHGEKDIKRHLGTQNHCRRSEKLNPVYRKRDPIQVVLDAVAGISKGIRAFLKKCHGIFYIHLRE